MPGLNVTLWTCGGCGKPRGWHHVCARRKTRRDRISLRVGVTRKCPKCGKQALNPLTHTCAASSDFKRRKAVHARKQKTDARRQKRRATAARKRARQRERKKAAADRRKRLRAEAAAARARNARSHSHDRNRHEYADCRDEGCGRSACRIYREGAMSGRAEGQAEGYAEGYAEGMSDACRAS